MASMENANDTYENVHVDPGPRPQSKSERKISLVIKFILFFFNVCMLLLGLLVTALGAWQLFEKHLVTEDRLRRLSGVINVLAAINIITGILIVSLSCAGCVGALRENLCLLRGFYWGLAVAVIVELGAAVTALVLRHKLKFFIERELSEILVINYERDEDAKTVLDILQRRAMCCGVTDAGYMDWNLNKYYNCSNDISSPLQCSVPFSCCLRPDTVENGVTNLFCGSGALKLRKTDAGAYVHTEGCLKRMRDIVEEHLPIAVAVAVAVLFLQIAEIILAKVLERQIQAQIAVWNSLTDLTSW